MLEDVIYQAINGNIKCAVLDVTGDGRHFDAVVVSDEFIGKNKIARHRLVYAALGDKMQEQIHALSLKTYTVEEYQQANG